MHVHYCRPLAATVLRTCVHVDGGLEAVNDNYTICQ